MASNAKPLAGEILRGASDVVVDICAAHLPRLCRAAAAERRRQKTGESGS
jgi:hypothetical protein